MRIRRAGGFEPWLEEDVAMSVATQDDLLTLLGDKATLLRIHSIRSTTEAGSGHPTSCASAAEIVAALFSRS